jgi:hypothetical protein
VHRWLHLDPDDPATTWTKERFQLLGFLWAHEDEAGNIAHTVLFIAATLTLLLLARRRAYARAPLLCAVGIVVGFLLFCSYLRWQPWHCRLHLPLLVLASPVIAVVMDLFWNWIISGLLVTVLIVTSVFWILDSSSHPLLGEQSIFDLPRRSHFFIHIGGPPAEQYFRQYIDFQRKNRCRVIGLNIGGDTPEYPVWVMLREGYPPTRVEHVNVINPSSVLANPKLQVDATLTLQR